ncbi:MAG: hypothetical protein WAT19_13170 [Ferruginibacter sp.]
MNETNMEENRQEAEQEEESAGSRLTQFMAYLFVTLVMLFLFVKIVFL